jgi:hypothetical protein
MHIEMSLHQRSMHIMKDGLEPFHLVGIARCASRGLLHRFGEEVSFARKQESSERAFFLNQASRWSSLRRKTVNWPARSEVEAAQSELAHTSAFSHI